MGRNDFRLDAYNTVDQRIVEFRTKHPEGSLRQVSLDFREVNGGWWVIYTAAAHRSPDDQIPGIGTAWEPIPGRTNFTRDSEVQNAETAAWGRASVAALAADTKKGIATREEVQARQQPAEDPQPYLDLINAAGNVGELADVGQRVAQANVSAEDRTALRAAYTDRLNILKEA